MASASNLDSLKKKRDIINARIRLVQNREQSKERKDNTRRKILIGSYYLEQSNKNNSFDDIVKLNIRGSKNIKRKIQDNKQSADLSYSLATIKCDVELPFDPEQLKNRRVNGKVLFEWFTKLEFNR